MRTKDIVIGEDYLVRTWSDRSIKATVTGIRGRHRNTHPGIVVEYVSTDSEKRTDVISPARVLQPWDERLEAMHREQLALQADAEALRGRIVSALDADRVHVSMGGGVTLYLNREQIEALL